ncbi:MAG: protein-glutamate O-methyltransferase CheR [Nitrospirota bacterium]
MVTKGLEDLFEYIHKTRGIDFALYRHATIKRKLDLLLEETGLSSYSDYLQYLKSNSDEIDNLIKTLTIKVSNFFRNPLVYELLYSNVLPEIISEFRFLKVWSIGCANGEEPYSIAIMVNELLKKERDFFDVKILGTDIDSEAIGKAITGEYHENELSEVKKKYLDAFFQKIPGPHNPLHEQEHIYRINNEIKSLVTLSCEDMIGRLRSRKLRLEAYNLLLCRNVLIYMNRELQEEILKNLSEIIYENGYLVLGETETIPEIYRNSFNQIFPGVKIYKKLTSIH